MCGIFCILSHDASCDLDHLYNVCKPNLLKRGPDAQGHSRTTICGWNILLSGCVLWLQGRQVTCQPVETDRSWFLFNGDVFDDGLVPSEVRNDRGDTLPLLDSIEASGCIETLEKVQGPYAFIYIDKVNSVLFFGRDTFGRRSLLIGIDGQKLILTSVATRSVGVPMIELPAIGVFSIDLRTEKQSIRLQPWKGSNQHTTLKLQQFEDSFHLKVECMHNGEPDKFVFKVPSDAELECLQHLEPECDVFAKMQADVVWSANAERLAELLADAVRVRVQCAPQFCGDCVQDQATGCDHCTVGVLFSGGVDCAVLALLADRFVARARPIDLLNVSFERAGNYDTPDRLTARQTLEELRTLRPGRNWRLLELNVSRAELALERSRRIADLIFPLRTVLDESLGCALWFAGRGRATAGTSACRVLLVGTGADELFGGYSRHRAAFRRGSWAALARELDDDWRAISHRNLARDDRALADHGRQARAPYLDERVAAFARALPAWRRCLPADALRGAGDKLLLRLAARRLGLRAAAALPKRALQFGSRIADRREDGRDPSPRL